MIDWDKTLPRLNLVVLTVISIVAAFDISTLAHEWTHATMEHAMDVRDYQ